MLLAIGKGSGSIEIWLCDISSREFDKLGSYDAHYYAVTGLAWAFGGRFLCSCSQVLFSLK
ncbi:transducin/WD40 repeat protein [Trifolium medium]|uniref:Transducin/WD40 repeat protein n=1 Tax=Trifolium medium TaxID=97028 RepID=A0A392RDA1_9FABA|nr:transducin/WD40 repeat protein [Trifolium medium]